MTSNSSFDPNAVSNPNNGIFGLPFTQETSGLVLLPVPWEVTVSNIPGTSRAPEHILNASLQIDIFEKEVQPMWKNGFFMEKTDKKLLTKNDYLRKEAELYISFIAQGEDLEGNKFMSKTLKEVNEGCAFMNDWVFAKTKELLQSKKTVGLVGGDHSTAFGFIKALASLYPDFGILQIDAHCDLRVAYQGFSYSHASIMHNVLESTPEVTKLVQLGIRDYCENEWNYITQNNNRIKVFADQEIKEQLFEGKTWKNITEEIVAQLPQIIYISFDVDGLLPSLCPHTGTPVPGGLDTDQLFYLFKKIQESGRKLIGFDLSETGTSINGFDENIASRILLKLCNFLTASQNQ
jgi:agmatinase